MKVCLFGEYQKSYSRNMIIESGLKKNNVEVLSFHLPYSKYKIHNYLKTMKNLSIFQDCDSVIFCTPTVSSYFPIGKILRKITNTIVIFDPFVSIYETEIEDRKRYPKASIAALIYWLIDKLSFSIPHISLADTLEHLHYYAEKFKINTSMLKLLPVGAYDDWFYPANRKSTSEKTRILFYGNYIPLHGAETIAKAAKYLNKNFEIIMIGYGQTYPIVKKIVRQYNLTNVKLKPPVSYAQLPEEIAKADICLGIFGTTEKAQRVIPNKVFEASAMGKAIITGNTAAIRREFQHEIDIYCIEPGNPKQLADAIILLSEDDQLRSKLEKNVYKKFKTKFSSKKIGSKLIRIINEVNMSR